MIVNKKLDAPELNEIIGELNAIESKLEGIIPYTKNKGANWKKD